MVTCHWPQQTDIVPYGILCRISVTQSDSVAAHIASSQALISHAFTGLN